MKAVRGVLLWLPAALWYRVIWGFSAQTAAVSGDLSDRLLWRLMNGLSPSFAGAGEALQSAAVELLSYFEREAADMVWSVVLAVLVGGGLARLGCGDRAAGAAPTPARGPCSRLYFAPCWGR